MNPGNQNQDALSFARDWELGPSPGLEPPPCEYYGQSRRSEQRMIALATGLGEIAETVSKLEQSMASASTALTCIEAAVKARSLLDDEVRRLRSVEHKTEILAPLYLGLIELLDRIEDEEPQIREFKDRLNNSPEKLARQALRWVHDARTSDRTDLRNLLALFGVEWFAPQPGEPFDPAQHKFLEYECYADARLHGRIARTRRLGYVRRIDNWVVRPAFVVVFKVTN